MGRFCQLGRECFERFDICEEDSCAEQCIAEKRKSKIINERMNEANVSSECILGPFLPSLLIAGQKKIPLSSNVGLLVFDVIDRNEKGFYFR